MPAGELRAAVAAGEVTTGQISAAMARRIEELNPALNAYVDSDPEQVLADDECLQRPNR